MSREVAVFAGGCFWCMVKPFEERSGILSVVSGYTGGDLEHPTYDQVHGGYTGHKEAVEILFDDTKISYKELLELYWGLIDPTDEGGQFYDRGDNYRAVIYVNSKRQHAEALLSKKQVEEHGYYDKPIVVPIEEAKTFWPAEDYHQDFYKTHPDRYKAVHRVRNKYYKKQEKKRQKLLKN